MPLQVRRFSTSRPFVCLMTSVIVALVMVTMPSSADAEGSASRLGATFNASGPVAVGSKVTDIAYDPVNDVYLTVSGPETDTGYVYGRFVRGDGTPLGAAAFRIPQTQAPTQLPRVAYSPALGGFLVTWIDGRVHPAFCEVWGRFLKYSENGAPAFTTGEFLVDTASGGTQGDVTAPVVCAGDKGECLVAWQQMGVNHSQSWQDIHAVRVNLSGERIGTEYFLSNDGAWQRGPAVAYDPATGIYLVAHTFDTSASLLLVHRIQAESGAALGTTHLASAAAIYQTSLALNTSTGQFLVSYYDVGTNASYGRFMKSDGTITSNVIALLGGNVSLDANSVAYSPRSGSFLAVTHGKSLEDIAYEISGAGEPSSPFVVTDVRGPNGVFYPRVAAHTSRPEWMLTASAYFTFVAGQRVTTTTNNGPGPGPGPNPETELIDLSPTGAPNGSWFMAEGVAQDTPNGFLTFYLIVNENPEPVSVRAYFSREDGKTFSRTFTVAANDRASLNLEKLAGLGTFGAVFQSLTPGLDIFVERSIYWGPNYEGSTAEVGTRTLSTEWYFGEGSRDFFYNYFMLFNPSQVAGQGTFTFYLENGAIVYRHFTIGPQQRFTLDGTSVPELQGQNFGVRVTSTLPVIAERAMYFGHSATGFIGGTASVGAPGVSTAWVFAEGSAAPGFDTFYLLMNPNPFPIDVQRIYFFENGTRSDATYTVPANSRKTVYLNEEMGDIGGTASHFSSAHGFVAERSIYWGAAGWVEGTNVLGTTSYATDWHVPEGTEGGEFDSFLLILNPNPVPVTADLILYIEGMGRFAAPVHMWPVIEAGSRKTINMHTFLTELEQVNGFPAGTLSTSSFSTRATTLSGQGIVVEHALYRRFDGANRWRSGSAAMAVAR